MNKRQQKGYDKIVARIKEGIALGKFYPDSRLIGDYVLNKTRIKAYCGNPNHNFTLSPSDFLSTKWSWCKECSGCCPEAAERKFHEACAKQGAVAIGSYQNTHTPCAVRCKNNHIRMRHPSNVVLGFGCDWCSGKCVDKNEEELRKLLTSINFVLLSPYINANTPLNLMCDKSHQINPRANDMFHKGTRCRICSGGTREQGLANLKKVLNDRGEVLLDEEEYVNNHTRIRIRCYQNHVYMGMPNNITGNGDGCAICDESRLERTARLVLEKYDIRHQKEYRDPLAPSLSFDFRFWHNEREYYLELDGSPHFSNECFYRRTDEEFHRAQERDRVKDLICWKRAVQLIRIPYTCLQDLEYYLLKSLELDVALICWDKELYEPLYRELVE